MNLELKSLYDFSLYSSATLGSNYRSAKLVAILTYEIARKFTDVDGIQQQISLDMPEGTPRDISKYQFYQFDHRGESIFIADYWMIPGSVKKTKGETYIITVEDTDKETMDLLTRQLNLLKLKHDIRIDD